MFTYVATYNVVSPQDIHNLQVRVGLHVPCSTDPGFKPVIFPGFLDVYA